MAGTIKLIRVVGGAGEAGARAIEPDQLVRGLKACEPWAERALLRAETAHVERLLARMLGFHAELDDLTQEVFIRAFARIGDLREPESLRAWLSSIAVFVAREAIRRKRRRRWLVFLPPEQPADLPASAASFEARNALRVFYEVLDGFAAEERIAFTLRFVEGMELTEVAEACQVSLATIKRRLSLIAQCSEGVCLNHPAPSATTCASIASQTAAAVADEETCTVVVRVDSVSLAATGHVLVCGPRNVVDEAGARASANAAPKVDGFEKIGTGDVLSGSAPSDVWLFHEIIGDFGHISAVSAANGATVFWGSLLWSAAPLTGPTLAGVRVGAPQAPTAWGTTEIGSGCHPSPAVARRDWEIRVGQNTDPTATPEQAAERVLGSALLHGVSANLPLTNAVTLHYGVSVSTTHPISEYIVIVNAAKSP